MGILRLRRIFRPLFCLLSFHTLSPQRLLLKLSIDVLMGISFGIIISSRHFFSSHMQTFDGRSLATIEVIQTTGHTSAQHRTEPNEINAHASNPIVNTDKLKSSINYMAGRRIRAIHLNCINTNGPNLNK